MQQKSRSRRTLLKFSDRVGQLPPYITAVLKEKADQMVRSGQVVYDYTLGDPDWRVPTFAKQALVADLRRGGSSRYQLRGKSVQLREAIASWYLRQYGIELDPATQIEGGLGSKAILFELGQTLPPLGAKVGHPDPCYLIHQVGIGFPGGVPVPYHVGPKYDPRDEIERTFYDHTDMIGLFVNFPHNPTAVGVDLKFYEWLVAFAKTHDLWVIADNAYAFDSRTPSILQVDGAMDCAVEVNSTSKRYGMAGWRKGWAAGCKRMVGRVIGLHSHTQYGAFRPLVAGAIAAINHGDKHASGNCALLKRRLEVLANGLTEAGWPDVTVPDTQTMYLYPPVPPQFQSLGSLGFALHLLEEAKFAVTPGIAFGPGGEGHVRLAAVMSTAKIRRSCEALKEFFSVSVASPVELGETFV